MEDFGDKIKQLENTDKKYVFGYEESYGSLIGPFVRDKDATQACLMLAEACQYYKTKEKDLVDVLNDIFQYNGAYYDTQFSISLDGVDGQIKLEETSAIDYVKNPILIKNNNNYLEITEKILQNLILENLPAFLKELGNGFSFIGNEYKIKIGERKKYIDLLLFNYEYNCFVVVELKVTELKKEHIGQIELYMNYIDKTIKKPTHDKTIGIIICKKDNKFVIEYVSDNRITVREYKIIN